MRKTQQMSITLPKEMAEITKAKVRTGEYASESEVIRDGLRIFQAHDRAIKNWLVGHVGPAFDALNLDPTRALAIESVRDRLAAEHNKTL